jgi:predicted metalloprotease
MSAARVGDDGPKKKNSRKSCARCVYGTSKQRSWFKRGYNTEILDRAILFKEDLINLKYLIDPF